MYCGHLNYLMEYLVVACQKKKQSKCCITTTLKWSESSNSSIDETDLIHYLFFAHVRTINITIRANITNNTNIT